MRQSAHKAYLPLFAGDYLADTLNFTVEEHGAYLLALIHQWNSGPYDEEELRLVLRFQRKNFPKFSQNCHQNLSKPKMANGTARGWRQNVLRH